VLDDGLIDDAWRAGKAAWPDLAVGRDRFAAHIAALDPRAVERFAADLYLATACLAGEPTAHARFEKELFASARQAIAAIDSSPTFVDEALQKLRAHVFVGDGGPPRLAAYAARGPLRAWLGVAAVRMALMMRRSQARGREVSTDDDDWSGAVVGVSTNNPEFELLKRQYATAFADAFRDAVAALEPRLRTVLRMSFVDALSIDEIGAVYAVHRATAARWIQRACDELNDAVRKLLVSRLSLSPTELEQLTALVRSQLDVSLSQLLPPSIE
jgi:RNA polymerase sigma-70 factor, ECF subfamily